jgi:siroheme synthase
MNIQYISGKVILAGAGPGDPELISVKAVKWLQKADVVLVDRLVSHEIINEWVNKAVLVCLHRRNVLTR